MINRGLTRGELILLDYREDYPSIFSEERDNLVEVFGDKIRRIDHIGSTSIIGIKSKPVIDILIQTDDPDDFVEFAKSNIANRGYSIKDDPKPGEGLLIRKEEDGRVKAFLHVYKTSDPDGISCIQFRDWLNSHEDDKRRYEKLKLELFAKHEDDRRKYTAEKNAFIREIIAKTKETI